MVVKQELVEENVFPRFQQERKSSIMEKLLVESHIKPVIFSGFVAYLSLLVVNISMASLFGYTVLTNYISDLGKRSVIPFSFMSDGISIFGGMITILSNLYLVRKLKTQYRPSKCSKEFVKVGFLSGIIGAIGYIFLGVFSLDRAGPGQWYHGAAMGFSFGGFLVSIFFYSITMVLTHECRLKKVGAYGMTFPFMFLVMFACTNHPLAEWLLLGSILVFYLLIFK